MHQTTPTLDKPKNINKQKKIAIINHHKLFREGLKHLIQKAPNLKVTEEWTSYKDIEPLLQKKRNSKWDIILCDISLPDINGIDLIKELNNRWPKTPILVLTMHTESIYGIQAIQAGAKGYITKDTESNMLIKAINKVLNGQRALSESFVDILAMHSFGDTETPPHLKLSRKEFQVLVHISNGYAPKQIASKMDISIKTVSTYKYRIQEKMNLSSTVEIIRYCIENKIS